MLCVPGVAHRHPTPLFFVVLFACLFCYAGAGGGGGHRAGDTLEGFRIDWCFRRGLYESEGGVACQHLVLWNSQMDFPCQ